MRLRTLTIGITLIVLASGLLAAPAFAKDPSVSTLRQRLQHARRMSQRAHERVRAATADLAGARELSAATNAWDPHPGRDPRSGRDRCRRTPAIPATMDQTLAATLLADGVVTADEVAALQVRLNAARRVAHRWDVKVRQLKQRIRQLKQIAEWNRRGQWKPLIAIASQRYDVSAAGLTHMMMLESGGQRHVDSGPYHGPLPVHVPRVGDELERVARPQHLRRLVRRSSSPPSASAAAWDRASGP